MREDVDGSPIDTPGESEQRMPEAELYTPIKQFLEAQGYVVKGEIGPCDVVAVRGDDERPVVVELKERLSLALILQAVDRLAVSDIVYMAFRTGPSQSASWRTRRKQVTGTPSPAWPGPPDRLGSRKCRPGVQMRCASTHVPSSSARAPPQGVRRAESGIRETGGSTSRQRVTAYRQDALRCARELAAEGVLKVSVLRERTRVSRAGSILRDNHYGWFDRVTPGHYALSSRGGRELPNWYEALARLPSRSVASVGDALTPQSLPLRKRLLHDGHRRPADSAEMS